MKGLFRMFAEAMKEEGFQWKDLLIYGLLIPAAIILLGAILEKICA